MLEVDLYFPLGVMPGRGCKPSSFALDRPSDAGDAALPCSVVAAHTPPSATAAMKHSPIRATVSQPAHDQTLTFLFSLPVLLSPGHCSLPLPVHLFMIEYRSVRAASFGYLDRTFPSLEAIGQELDRLLRGNCRYRSEFLYSTAFICDRACMLT